MKPRKALPVAKPTDGPSEKLTLAPIYRDQANEWIRKVHRHHRPTLGYRFALAAMVGERLCGVAVAGRPVARLADDGRTLEVTRVATDGTRNACSFLYGAMRKAARALGYARTITYTLPTESGASLRGAGFRLVKTTDGGKWSRQGRLRIDDHPTCAKLLWEAA